MTVFHRHHTRSRLASSGAVALLVFGLAGCGSSSSGGSSGAKAYGSSPSTSAAAGGATGNAINIKNFKFSPNPLKAKVGATITITNTDGTDHTVSADDKSFDTGKFSEGSKTFTVDKAGTYSFHCNVHDYMKGVIQVTG